MSSVDQSGVSPDELGALARRALSEQTKRRMSYDTGASSAASRFWPSAAELGWLLLTIPEDKGGLGQDFSTLSALYIELGRALSPLPLLHSMMAVDAVLASNSNASDEILAAIGSGKAILAVQLPNCSPVTARAEGSELLLEGKLANVYFPANATHLLLFARDGSEILVVLAAVDNRCVTVTARETWDWTRELADIDLRGCRVSADAVLARGKSASDVLVHVKAHFDLSIACDSIGGAEQILMETVEYSKVRRQFGREIGSFQAIKHRCADMKTWLEAAKALTNAAIRRFVAGEYGSPLIGSAKLYASQTYREIAMDAVQIHGGIGFTWEHDCHLFLKRALLNEQLGGSAEQYKDSLFEPFAALAESR